MSAPEIVRAQRQRPAAAKHMGQVVALGPGYRARVTIASGTVTVAVPGAHRSVQKDDTVEVTWSGGDPRITDVITRHTPPTFTASGANTATYSANTAPPSAVSGSSIAVTKSIDTSSLVTSGTITYNADKFTTTHVALLNTLIGRINTAMTVLDDAREVLHGPSGTTGLKAGYASVRSRTDDIQAAANTLRTNVTEVRNVAATFLKTEGPKQGISQ